MYNYKDHRDRIFTEEGQKEFLRVRDRVNELLSTCKYIDIMQAIGGIGGSAWENMAMVDRMVELGELVEIKTETGNPRIFIKA
jgi:hypothetical protein